MTIFLDFDPSNHPNNTELTSLGWTVTPFIDGNNGQPRRGTFTMNLTAGSNSAILTGATGNVGFGSRMHGPGVPIGTTLNTGYSSFPTPVTLSNNATQTITGATLIVDEYYRTFGNTLVLDYQSGLNSSGPKALYNTGSTYMRGYTKLEDGECFVIVAKDTDNFIRCERNDVRDAQNNVYASFLLFFTTKDGIHVSNEDYDFPYYNQYDGGSFFNQYAVLPPQCNLSWEVNGDKLKIYIDGVLQKMRRRDFYDPNVTEMTLPSFIVGATSVGYFDAFGGGGYAFPLKVRDNNSLIVANGPVPVRADRYTSRIKFTGTCNISGATAIRVKIYLPNNTLISDTTATFTAPNFEVQSLPVDRVNENLLFRIELSNVGGTLDTVLMNYNLPTTVISGDPYIGQNDSGASYFSAIWPFNDLAKSLAWRVRSRFILAPNVNPAFYAAGGYDLWLPASYIGLTAKGSPTKFPDDPTDTVLQQMPYYPEIGDYVMDMTEAPNLKWIWTGDQNVMNNLETHLDFYGTNIHRIRVKSTNMRFWGIEFVRDATKANFGMPTTDWLMRCTRVGTDDNMYWSQEYLNWIADSGVTFLRYMSNQYANEGFINRQWDVFTAANRVTLDDQCWVESGHRPSYPQEAIVQLHNRVKLDIWDNFPRLCDESYIRDRAAYYRDNLDPDLKIIWAMSNEVWNFAFRQYFGYNIRGNAQGLGRLDAVYGADNGTYVYTDGGGGFPFGWAANNNYPTIGTHVGWGGHIYRNTAAITASGANQNPQIDTARWEIFQLGHVATYRAHINQFRQMREWIVDEFGGEEACKARCFFVCEVHHAAFNAQVDEYITWGDNWQYIDAIATGPYFGSTLFNGAGWNSLPATVRNVMQLTGSARIEGWKTAAMAEALAQADIHILNARRLADKVVAAGGEADSVQLWQYEGGQHFFFNFTNSVLQAAGQATVDQELLRQDILAFYKDHMYDIYMAYYERMIEGTGGRIGHFDSFIAYRLYFSTPTPNYQLWGVSGFTDDKANTSSRYRALRDLSLDNGGEIKDFMPVITRRRRQSNVI